MVTILDFKGTNNDTGEKIEGFAYTGSKLCTTEDSDFALEYACENPEQPRTYKNITYDNYAQFFQANPNYFLIYDSNAEPDENGAAILRTGEWTNITVEAVWMSWLDDNSKITP